MIAWKHEVLDSGANGTIWAGTVGGGLGDERGGMELRHQGPGRTSPQSLPSVRLAIVGQGNWEVPKH